MIIDKKHSRKYGAELFIIQEVVLTLVTTLKSCQKSCTIYENTLSI